jgi:hypothetical protein
MTPAELDSSALKSSVAFTGRLACMTRAEAFEVVRQHGGTPSQTVTKRTKLLIVGELGWPLLDDGRPSNKLARARSYSVPVEGCRWIVALHQQVITPFGFGNISGLLSRLSVRKQIIGIVPTVIDRKHELAAFVSTRSSLFDFEAIAGAGMEPQRCLAQCRAAIF